MKTFKELESAVIKWGEDRGLYDPVHGATPTSQLHKFFEEFGELNKAIGKNDLEQIKDGIGDAQICLIARCELKKIKVDYSEDFKKVRSLENDEIEILLGIITENCYNKEWVSISFLEYLAHSFGFKKWECLEYAYNEIKDRKGKLINRTFVKDA